MIIITLVIVVVHSYFHSAWFFQHFLPRSILLTQPLSTRMGEKQTCKVADVTARKCAASLTTLCETMSKFYCPCSYSCYWNTYCLSNNRAYFQFWIFNTLLPSTSFALRSPETSGSHHSSIWSSSIDVTNVLSSSENWNGETLIRV